MRSLTMFVALSLLSVGAPAQEVDLEIAVRHVELDVHVVNLLRNPVPGLSRDRFKIKEDGQLRPLLGFEELNYLELQPGQSADVPRVLIMVNFLNDPLETRQYLDALHDYFNKASLGAWQVGLGFVDRSGMSITTPFTSAIPELQEGARQLAGFYDGFDMKSHYRRNAHGAIDAARRSSQRHGFNSPTHENPYTHSHLPLFDLNPVAISRFVRLVSAYSGHKEVVVLGPALWSFSDDDGGNRDRDPSHLQYYAASSRSGSLSHPDRQDLGFDLNEVVTNCIANKIRLSRFRAIRNTEQVTADSLISATGGLAQSIRYQGLDESLNDFLRDAGHFYRLRFETTQTGQDLKARRVNVNVSGLGLIADHAKRYYPVWLQQRDDFQSQFTVNDQFTQVTFSIPESELLYERIDGQDRAQFAFGVRGFDDHQLVFESVQVFTPLEHEIAKYGSQYVLNLQPPQELANLRLELITIDLLTGRLSSADLVARK